MTLLEVLVYRSPTDLALELVNQMLSSEEAELPVVLASACGENLYFQEHVRPRQLSYVIPVEFKTVICTEDFSRVPVPPCGPAYHPRR